MNHRTSAATLTFFSAWAVSGCGGHRERASDVAFTEKSCGQITENRPADPVQSTATTVLSAKAFQKEDGDLTILVNPVVSQTTGTVQQVAAEDLTIVCGGREYKPTDVNKISSEHPAATDLVFVLDTTGSMLWAINAMIEGVSAFATNVASLGLDARIGGIEFGDEIRTSQDLTDSGAFAVWVEKLGELAGGDAPENPIDSILKAYESFSFRRDAQKYFMMITDAGMHEVSDGSGCADHNLADLVAATRGDVLFAVASSAGDTPAGVTPKAITETMGGLYVPLQVNPLSNDFDLSRDTNFDSFLADTVRVEVPASACAKDPNGEDPRSVASNLLDRVTVKYERDGQSYESEVVLTPAP